MSVSTGIEEKRKNIDRLLRPRSIALVGASSTPGSLGDSVLANLEENGFSGELHLVNPKRPVIRGRQAAGSIEELPEGIDCAVLAIPGAAVLPAARACAAKGVASLIIFSAGFAEGGEEGRAAQQELTRIAGEHGMTVEGPNCLGMVNYVEGIPLTFVVTPPQERTMKPGAAIISQSGALAAVIAVNMRHQKIPLTYSISTGNEAASGVEDYVEHLLGDAATRVLALVVEQFRRPKRFLELARRAEENGQAIVLLHPGSSTAARASAATHTGAIAGDYAAMQTMVTRAGVIHVETMEELVDVTQMLVRGPERPRAGAAIFTESGAFKALCLDLCERIALELPALSEGAERGLREALPAFIPPSNPLDLTAQGLVDTDLYRRTLPPVLNDERFGSVLLGIILTDASTRDRKLPPIIDGIRSVQTRKPILFAALDEGAPFESPEMDTLRELGVACFPSPERAMRALARVTAFGARQTKREKRQDRVETTIQLPRSGTLSESESKEVLRRIGIAVPAGGLARSREEALRLAQEVGFPVALKAHSAELPHKTEAGAVRLGIDCEGALLEAWDAIHRNVQAYRPGLALDGILVERMGPKGIELIVGARNDAQWGPVLLVGLGGILAEAMRDTRLLPCGLSAAEIREEVLKLRGAALLKGFRGAPAADVDAVVETIARLGELMESCPEITEVDINPLLACPVGAGALALDALMVVSSKQN